MHERCHTSLPTQISRRATESTFQCEAILHAKTGAKWPDVTMERLSARRGPFEQAKQYIHCPDPLCYGLSVPAYTGTHQTQLHLTPTAKSGRSEITR